MNGKFMQKKLQPYLGKNIHIQYNLGRNKYETYTGKITKLFPNIFLFEEEKGTIKSFSYSDVVTKTIRISMDKDNCIL